MKVNYDINKKHPQSILGFFSQYFEGRFHNGLTEYPYERFLEEVYPYHLTAERNMLENWDGVRQALPCVAIRQKRPNGETQYWGFRRTDKVGEARIAGMVACFWGGHVDAVDVSFNDKSVLALDLTLKVGRDREQGEEYRIFREASPFEKDWSIKLPLTPANQFIANSTVEVDRHHVAIIYTVDLPEDHAVEVREDELEDVPPMTAQEALDAHEAGQFELESWALIYFRHVRAKELLDSGAVVAIDPVPERLADVSLTPYKRSIAGIVKDGEISEADKAQGYSWPVKIQFGQATDWDHGPLYDAYVARRGKNWDEFKRKVILMFGIEGSKKVWETPEDTNATALFPAEAEAYRMLFRSAGVEHTVGQMLTVLDLLAMDTVKAMTLIHVQFDADMNIVDGPYKLVNGEKVPHKSVALERPPQVVHEEGGDEDLAAHTRQAAEAWFSGIDHPDIVEIREAVIAKILEKQRLQESKPDAWDNFKPSKSVE